MVKTGVTWEQELLVIAACREAYRAGHKLGDARTELTCAVAREWRLGDARDVLSAVAEVRFALYTTPGAYDAWDRLRTSEFRARAALDMWT